MRALPCALPGKPGHEYILIQRGLDLYPVVMSIVHWGDTHMVDERGRSNEGMSICFGALGLPAAGYMLRR